MGKWPTSHSYTCKFHNFTGQFEIVMSQPFRKFDGPKNPLNASQSKTNDIFE